MYEGDSPDLYIVNTLTDGPLADQGAFEAGVLQVLRHLPPQLWQWGSSEYHDTSVYTGVLGVAVMNLHLYRVFGSTGTTSTDNGGKQYLDVSAGLIDKVSSAIQRRHRRRDNSLTFHTGIGGLLALEAVVHSFLGRQNDANEAKAKLLAQIEKVVNDDDLPNEMLYGRSGFLQSILFVRQYLNEASYGREVAIQVIERVIRDGVREGRSRSADNPLHYDWHDTEYLGAAHGYAGIYLTLLSFVDELRQSRVHGVKETPLDLVQRSLDHLLNTYKSKHSANMKSSCTSNNDDKLVHWCHGAPGYIPLLLAAGHVYNSRDYIHLAGEMGDVVWARGLLRKGVGLCHGISGNASTFLSLWRSTGKDKWLHRAHQFGNLMVMAYLAESRESPIRTTDTRPSEPTDIVSEVAKLFKVPDRPMSLYEGLGGMVCLLADLLAPEISFMPGYEAPMMKTITGTEQGKCVPPTPAFSG